LKDRSARDVIYELLFWSGTSIRYDGNGEFTFFQTENKVTTVEGQPSTELKDYLYGLSPFDLKHTTNETGSELVPEGITYYAEILDEERDDNSKEEYHKRYISVSPTNTISRGRKIHKAHLPIVHIELREDDPVQEILAQAEYYEYIEHRLADVIKLAFRRYPSFEADYGGFHSLAPQKFLDRVSWYSLGGQPGTKVESKVPIDWRALCPSPIIPRELKLSVVIAKVVEDVDGDDVTFTFEEPRLLLGQLFETDTAYNTHKRTYVAGEEIILIGGGLEAWRHSSLLLENYTEDQLYFTIDDIPYLRLKVLKTDLVQVGSDIDQGWKVLLENVSVVNGKIPYPDDDEETQDYLYIKNSPRITLDTSDAYIYIGYDHLAGADVYHRWSVSDPQNDILFLKGLPGYVNNPVEPSESDENQRRLVLKSPFSATSPIGWLEEASDGRTDEELEQFIINVFEEQGGGGGGEGASTFIMKAVINNTLGYDSDDPTVNWSGGVVLVSDGTVQPTAGSADNTFSTAFLNTEPILLIKKNNGVWTAIKIQENIIIGTPVADVASNASTFTVTLSTTVQGTAPTGTITAKGNGFEYMLGEKLGLKHGNDGNWHVIERYEDSAIFRTVSLIGAANFNSTTGVLSIGQGTAQKMTCNTGNPLQYSIVAGTPTTAIRNMARTAVAANKNIQAKRIGRHWFVDVEDCG
jgi:hypothetical protein